jgi:hypothetical protein
VIPKERVDDLIPGRVDTPATRPRLLTHCAESKGPVVSVPPRFPRSVIFPFCQRKACEVGILVSGFGVEFMKENHFISPPGTANVGTSMPARCLYRRES